MRRLFYSSPVDARNLEEWGGFADTLRRAVLSTCGKGIAVEVGDRAVFRRGGDFEETLAGLEELRLGRAVRVDLWSSVAGYGVIAFTLGFDIKRAERRALEKKLRKALRGEVPLRDLEGVYSEESGLVVGFALSAADDAAARADVEHLLFPFEKPLYLGERWLLQDGDERLDESSFQRISEPAPGLVTFLAADGDAEERIWRHCGSGDGLIALFPDDPVLPDLVRGFRQQRDLRILTSKHPHFGLRVTIDRRPGGDPLVVAYTATGPPEIEELPLFVV
ncbi:MAG: hypothetical protein AAFX50_06945 [Acidobacteriota bacterium]